MILIDSSVWIDHFRQPLSVIFELAEGERILSHPFVIGELALGSIKDRREVIDNMAILPKAIAANDEEVLMLIERKKLFGRGIGYADAHLIASTLLTDGARLWSFDRRLTSAAQELGCAADLPAKNAN